MRHRSPVGVILLTVAVAASLAGCGKLAESLREAQRPAKVDLYGTDLIARTAKELEAKLGGGPLRVLVITAERDWIEFEVQDPKKPENVDMYEYRQGRLDGPRPVQLLGEGKLEDNLFSLSEVDLTRIPAFVQAAQAKLALEGGKPTSLSIRLQEPSLRDRLHGKNVKSEIRATLYIDSDRRKGYVDGDSKFEIVNSNVL